MDIQNMFCWIRLYFAYNVQQVKNVPPVRTFFYFYFYYLSLSRVNQFMKNEVYVRMDHVVQGMFLNLFDHETSYY